jgi:hypothetical protein
MTPFELGIMLHYYAQVGDPEAMRRQPPILGDTLACLEHEQLLRPTADETEAGAEGATYVITERGRAYVDALLSVPLPTRTWRVQFPDPRGPFKLNRLVPLVIPCPFSGTNRDLCTCDACGSRR